MYNIKFLCASLVSLSTRIITYYVIQGCYQAISIGSVVWLLHGVTITLAIIELLTKKTLLGTAFFFYGMIVSAFIGFGLDFGTTIFSSIAGISQQEALSTAPCIKENEIYPGWYPFLLIITSISFNMLINSHYKQLLPMTSVAILAFLTSYISSSFLGKNGTIVASSFVASSASHLISHFAGTPSIIYTIAGLFMLVPGSLAVNGFSKFLQEDRSGGMELAVDVVICTLALSVGIFFSSIIFKQKETSAWYDKIKRKSSNIDF
jgi:uncharacterized membrane protein YjjB (DUF3815 family)